MKNFVMAILACLLAIPMQAQTVVQPKIMVIPYTKEGEDIRTVLEADENKRIVLTKIKEAFDERGVTTIDFIAKLKAMESGNVFNLDNKQDAKSLIIDMSGADIYIEAEIICQQGYVSGKEEGRVKVVVTAYETATGASLANKVGESGTFYTSDIGKLGMKAISSCADDFLRVMQTKFSDIAENGRSLMLQIGFEENSQYTMESEVGNQGVQLQDEIELWVEEHSHNGNYHLQGVSPMKMVFDDIKLPLTDETGKNYSTSKFGMEILRFFRSLNLQVSRSNRGNTLYITIK
ncbi:MAG: hypothetical protein IJ640_07320 [Prevotella sp.]|nr:hypothetical protein [Prevotella sp.]